MCVSASTCFATPLIEFKWLYFVVEVGVAKI